jgi:Tol biopolymer transport system component
MRRATIFARRAVAVAASLATASLAITAAPAAAAGPPAAGPPGTGRIAFSDFMTGQVYAVNPDGSGLAQLTHEPSGIAARWPDWSPNGSRVLFARVKLSNFVGRIWIMNANGTGRRQLASGVPGRSDFEPRYTPDGRHIVFTQCLPFFEHCAIWIMRSDGTHRHLIVPFLPAPNETNNFDPKVSPDGRRITFTRFGFHGVISQVWVARIDGTHARPLTAPRLEASGPSWSPDGRHIAFASNCCRVQSSLYAMRADGTGVTRLATTKWPTNNFGPAYSPNGRQIAFSSDRRHPDLCCEDLFIMRANGSRQHLVDTGIQGVIDVAWGSAPLVPAGSPGTLSRPAAPAPAPGSSRSAGCHKAPAWLTGNMPVATAPSGHPRIAGNSPGLRRVKPCA